VGVLLIIKTFSPGFFSPSVSIPKCRSASLQPSNGYEFRPRTPVLVHAIR